MNPQELAEVRMDEHARELPMDEANGGPAVPVRVDSKNSVAVLSICRSTLR